MSMTTIPRSARLLRRFFEGEGFCGFRGQGWARNCWPSWERQPVSLITLDLNLDGENGLDLARQVRKERNVPIIMLTGKGDAIDRVVGLELGADDYLVKPFELRELLARVRAVLRRSSTATSPTKPRANNSGSKAGCWMSMVREPLAGQIRSESRPHHQRIQPARSLSVKRPHRVLSRDDIMDLLKGQDSSPLDRSIDNLIARLRKKIEQDPDHPRLVKTVRGVGYAFTADAERQA